MNSLSGSIVTLLVSLYLPSILRSEVVDSFSGLKSAIDDCGNTTCKINISGEIFVDSTLQVRGRVEIDGTASDGSYPTLVTSGSNSIFNLESFNLGSQTAISLSLQHMHVTSNRSSIIADGETVGKSLVTLGKNTSLSAVDCLFTNGTAESGAAIHSSEESNVTLDDCILADNIATATSGGAVGLYIGSVSEITNCTFRRNTAYSRGGSLHAMDSKLVILNSFFFHDKSDNGASVSCELSSKCEIKQCSFQNTAARFAGGAIESSFGSLVQVNESRFYGAHASFGGALHTEYGSRISVYESIFSEVCSVFSGGVINLSGGSLGVVSNSTFNSSRSESGGVFRVEYNSTIEVLNNVFTSNYASLRGGVGYVSDSITIMCGNVFLNCTSVATGGAFHLSSSKFTMTSGLAVGNEALQGGFLYLEDSVAFIGEKGKEAINTSLCVGSVFHSCLDMYSRDCCSSVDNGTAFDNGGNIFNCNEAIDGGVINSRSSSISLMGNNWKENKAITSSAISLQHSSITADDDYFGYNFAEMAAVIKVSDIRSDDLSFVVINNCTFQSNQARLASGSVISIVSGSMHISNSSFVDNNARSGDGTIAFSMGALLLKSCTFRGNKVNRNGGAVFAGRDANNCDVNTPSTMSSNVTIDGCIFDSNLAGNFGGAVDIVSSIHANISDSHFLNNTSTFSSGGALGAYDCLVNVANSKFKNNRALLGGGGAYFWKHASSSKGAAYITVDAPTTHLSSNNSASFGSFGASDFYSMIVKQGDESFVDLDSGQVLPPIQVEVLDFYGHVDKNAKVDLMVVASNYKNCSIQGDTFILNMRKGAVTIDDISVFCPAGVSTFLNITSMDRATYQSSQKLLNEGVLKTAVLLQFRYCKPGEKYIQNVCTKCPEGTVLLTFDNQVSCDACPMYATCPGGNQLVLDAGYWRLDSTSMMIRRCPVQGNCEGGNDTSTQCAEGTMGYYCAQCQEGYVMQSDGQCISCKDTAKLGVITVVPIFIFCVLLVAFIFKKKIKLFIRDQVERAKHKLSSYNLQGLQSKLKILVAFMQIVLEMGNVLQMYFPDSFLEFMNIFSFLKVDFLRLFFFDLGCQYTINFYTKLVFNTLIPIFGYVLCLFGLFLYHQYSLYTNGQSSEEPFYPRDKMIQHFTSSGLLIAFFSFMPVSTDIFQTFGCQLFDDGNYRLIADYSINCDPENAKYQSYKAYAGFMILVYPIGIPLFYLLLLLRFHDRVNPTSSAALDDAGLDTYQKHLIAQSKIEHFKYDLRLRMMKLPKNKRFKDIGFLYNNYKPSCWYFEIVMCVQRLSIGTIPILFERGTMSQIVVVLMIALFFCGVTIIKKPFHSNNDNKVAIVSLITIVIILLSSMLLRVASYEPDSVNMHAIGVILILLNVNIIIFTVYTTLISDDIDMPFEDDGDNDGDNADDAWERDGDRDSDDDSDEDSEEGRSGVTNKKRKSEHDDEVGISQESMSDQSHIEVEKEILRMRNMTSAMNPILANQGFRDGVEMARVPASQREEQWKQERTEYEELLRQQQGQLECERHQLQQQRLEYEYHLKQQQQRHAEYESQLQEQLMRERQHNEHLVYEYQRQQQMEYSCQQQHQQYQIENECLQQQCKEQQEKDNESFSHLETDREQKLQQTTMKSSNKVAIIDSDDEDEENDT